MDSKNADTGSSYVTSATAHDREIYERDNDISPDSMQPVASEGSLVTEPSIVKHRLTRGAELIPRSPLGRSIANTSGVLSVLALATGTVVTLMGVLIQFLMNKYATKQGPALWWAGVGPFASGIVGLYSASCRSRRKIYVWGTCTMLFALTQTAIMGWVGNYTTSHYDVWPLHENRNHVSVCTMMASRCHCQDYYHGVYSTVELPGVFYFYKDDIKWRRTVFDTCGHLGAITALFWSFHVAWLLFVISAIISCGFSMAGSVCAKQDGADFEKLKEIDKEDEELTATLEADSEENLGDGRLEVVYSEFERY